MRLCSYVVKKDAGFAPNPFFGYCTLTACTPNHQGIKLKAGDWLMGNSTAARGQRLVYAMRVSEVLPFEDYYADPRFAAKKPRPAGAWQHRSGDNIYHRAPDGDWIQDPNRSHNTVGQLQQDTKYPRVYISDYFFYFGRNAPAIPAEFGSLIRPRQGTQCTEDEPLIGAFVDWLESNYRPGRLGNPQDAAAKRKGCPPDEEEEEQEQDCGVC
jgi:hypothetical protein